MKVVLTEKLKTHFERLPENVRKKASKQFLFLSQNLRHPSIRAKKLEGYEDVWEGRIDRSYRFVFTINEGVITVLRVGPHDGGLGKK